jgi:hypothetical protein
LKMKKEVAASVLAVMIFLSMLCSLPWVFADYIVAHASFPPDLPGDVTGDAKVDIRDVAIVSKAFGSVFGGANWNPIADVNDDGKVDIKDISVVSKLYGTLYDASSTPIAYSTSFNFTVPSDGDYPVNYYVLSRVYVNSSLSGQRFYFVASADDGVQNVKLDNSLKAGSGGSVNIDLGTLSKGYHLIEFEFVEVSGGGWLSFHVATASGQPAWLDRFRIYLPNYSNNMHEYTVTTRTCFPIYDNYYLEGFADDYICNFKVDSTQWYEWEWSTQQETINAWEDGFLYPVFNSKETGIFNIEFTFGGRDGGVLDFQFLSCEYEKARIGNPRFWAQTKITPAGSPEQLVELYDYSTQISCGSHWCDVNGVPTSNPMDFEFITQAVELLMNVSGGLQNSILQKVTLATSLGWIKMDPRENDYYDVGIMFNLTGGDLYFSWKEGNETNFDQWDWDVWFQLTSLEIWTPQSVAAPEKIVFANETPTTSFVGPDLSIAKSFAGGITTGLLYWGFRMIGGTLAGPFGIVAATAGGSLVEAMFNFFEGQKVVGTQQVTQNSTYLRAEMKDDLYVNTETGDGGNKANSGTQAVFIRIRGIDRYHCGAIKIKTKSIVAVRQLIILGGQAVPVEYRMEIEQTFILPLFIRD